MTEESYLLEIAPSKLIRVCEGEVDSGAIDYLNSLDQVQLCVSPQCGEWEFRFKTNACPPPENLSKSLQEFFMDQVDGLRCLHCLSVSDKKVSLDKWLEEHWEILKTNILRVSPVLRSALEYARPRVENGTLQVELADTRWLELCRERSLDKFIQKWLRERCGRSPAVEFVIGDFSKEIESDARRFQVQEEKKLQKKQRRQKLRAKKEKETVLLGRKIQTDIVSIGETKQLDKKRVTVRGRVIESEFRKTSKDKSNFVKGIITDSRNSISFIIFLDESKPELTGLEGEWLKIRGNLKEDNYGRNNDDIIFVNDVNKIPPLIRSDDAPVKRVELHCHTNMSQLDALPDVNDIVERAAFWDQPAVAVSDHGVVHSFPEAAKAGQKYGVKILYGMEGYLVNDKRPFILNRDTRWGLEEELDEEFIVLDCETTGVSPCTAEPFQLCALRIKEGEIVDSYQSPLAVQSISGQLLKQSTVDKEELLEAPPPESVIEDLTEFVGEKPVLIYEADFVRNFLEKIGFSLENPIVHLRRLVENFWAPDNSHLNEVFLNRFKGEIEHDFDARQDARRTLQIFSELEPRLPEPLTIKTVAGLEATSDYHAPFNHVLLLARNETGLENLYRLVSRSHTEYFYRQPRILRSELEDYREGLLIGSACEQGEIFQSILQGDSENRVKERMKFYDFIELQPVGNNKFMLDAEDDYDDISSYEDLKELNRRLYCLGKEIGKPVVATSDAHFIDPGDEKFRRVLQAGQEFSDADNQPPVYMRTTEEMIDEFDYLGEDAAVQIVVDNTRLIAGMCENIQPVPDEFYPPEVENARSEFKTTVDQKAHRLYGETLPEPVQKRLRKEKEAILRNQFENLYVMAARLVEKSLEDNYLVGSRGSVGSSFTAFLMGITEVNPLPPHYRCPDCKNTVFPGDHEGLVGVDLPAGKCPECETEMARDGFHIPFEVFCGFEGNKVPDIDLNFSGEYQPRMFRYVEEIFGKENVFRAGTITTVSDRTAAGFVNGYVKGRNIRHRKAERERLIRGVKGIKQNTSQHPGGMIIVPEDKSIYEFSPINYPANDSDSEFLTTHFDYHAMEEQLVKLDILGHDDPTQLRHLQELTGLDPVKIPLDDEQTLQLFSDISVIDLEPEQLEMQTGVLAVPEFGTTFVRDMVEEAKPSSFADLVRISGLSHGTNVWLGNARNLINSGQADLTSVITCRDDIMNFLMDHGLPDEIAFEIMEDVRKGRGLDQDQVQKMKANGVPEWYIKSCQKIEYLFPKAHAAAYVIMAFRIAYFKVHHPAAFYASFFSLKANYLDTRYITSLEKVTDRLEELERIIDFKRQEGQTYSRDQSEYSAMEVMKEAYLREIEIKPPLISRSDASRFKLESDSVLRAPYVSIDGLGGTVAKGLEEAHQHKKFTSIEDVTNRTQINSTVAAQAREVGFFENLPETENIDLFAS